MPAAEYDQLHHFIGAGTWEEAALEREVLVQADRLVGDRPTAAAEPARDTDRHHRALPPPLLPTMSVPVPAATPN
jgi:hypothetical protein